MSDRKSNLLRHGFSNPKEECACDAIFPFPFGSVIVVCCLMPLLLHVYYRFHLERKKKQTLIFSSPKIFDVKVFFPLSAVCAYWMNFIEKHFRLKLFRLLIRRSIINVVVFFVFPCHCFCFRFHSSNSYTHRVLVFCFGCLLFIVSGCSFLSIRFLFSL